MCLCALCTVAYYTQLRRIEHLGAMCIGSDKRHKRQIQRINCLVNALNDIWPTGKYFRQNTAHASSHFRFVLVSFEPLA